MAIINSTQNIAVLVTCHNRRDKTFACLQSLFAADLPGDFNTSVYLVDDGSSDGTAQMITENYPTVTVIRGDGNLYWNRGMHLAWVTAAKVGGYNYYLWLNDDTLLFANALQLILSAAAQKPGSIICGTTCSKKTGQFSYGGYKRFKKLIPDGQLQECDEINGNVVLVPDNVAREIGILDPVFHHALGDTDYGLRARKRGLINYIAADYVGYCENPDTELKWQLADIPLLERLKILYSPLGYSQPKQQFIFENRHHGFFYALYHLFTIHLHVIFPKLWYLKRTK